MGSVLVVEDSSELRDLYRWLMENEGCQTVEAVNGAEALDILKRSASSHFCLIILDLMMPGMDGWEFLKRKALDPMDSVPVVICSAVRDRSPPNIDFLPKPINIDHLLAKIRHYCTCS